MPKADGHIGVVQLLTYLPRQRPVLQVKMGRNSVLEKLTRGRYRGHSLEIKFKLSLSLGGARALSLLVVSSVLGLGSVAGGCSGSHPPRSPVAVPVDKAGPTYE